MIFVAESYADVLRLSGLAIDGRITWDEYAHAAKVWAQQNPEKAAELVKTLREAYDDASGTPRQHARRG